MSKELRLSEYYPAPPERLFRAWSEPEQVKRWFGCGPNQLWTVHCWDCRPGGALEVSMEFDGEPFRVTGEFLVVEAPHRLSYRFGEERIEVQFIAEGRGTRLELLHRDIPNDEHVQIRTGGWTFCLGTSLRAYVEPAERAHP